MTYKISRTLGGILIAATAVIGLVGCGNPKVMEVDSIIDGERVDSNGNIVDTDSGSGSGSGSSGTENQDAKSPNPEDIDPDTIMESNVIGPDGKLYDPDGNVIEESDWYQENKDKQPQSTRDANSDNNSGWDPEKWEQTKKDWEEYGEKFREENADILNP